MLTLTTQVLICSCNSSKLGIVFCCCSLVCVCEKDGVSSSLKVATK